MAMSWWKCSTNIFEDDKILIIESTQKAKADLIILIWFRLLTLSAKLNNGGIFKFNNEPYPFEVLCQMLHKTGKKGQDDVKLALTTLNMLGMIEYNDGIVVIKNWNNYQSQDKYNDQLEKNRERQKKFREKQKQESEINPELQEILKGIHVAKKHY